MPSVHWKVNFFFKGLGQGWSETWYFDSSILQEVRANSVAFARKRSDCMAADYNLFAIRLTNEDADRDSLLFSVDMTGTLDPTLEPDYPGTALLVRLGVQNTYWRALYFRGIPDSLINANRNSNPTFVPPFLQAFNKWVQFLLGATLQPGSWRMKVIDKTASPKIDLLDITDLGADRLSLTTVTPHGLAVGDTAIVYNVRGLPIPLGRKQVVVVTNANTFQIRGSLPAGFAYAGTGKVRKFAALYPVITRADFANATHRNTGRPFGQQRGSRRRKLV
jgi:hypothetical protein